DRDVTRFPSFVFVVQIRQHRIPRKGFEHQRRDEQQGVSGHHPSHRATLLGQLAREIGSFVCRNRPGHPQHNVFGFLHWSILKRNAARSGFNLSPATSNRHRHSSGATAREPRSFSASTIANTRRKSSSMLSLITR